MNETVWADAGIVNADADFCRTRRRIDRRADVIDAAMKPIARCGYDEYAMVETVFKMTRPKGGG